MSNPLAANGKRQDVVCTCGLTFADPWELVAHFLAIYPARATRPLDGRQHADVTRLAVKLGIGTSGAWEVTTWAAVPPKYLRVAASIAHKVKIGDLKRFDTMTQQDIRDAHHVSLHVAGHAMNSLIDYGVFRNYGSRNGVASNNVDRAISESFPAGQLLNTIAHHVARIEDEVSALKERFTNSANSLHPSSAIISRAVK